MLDFLFSDEYAQKMHEEACVEEWRRNGYEEGYKEGYNEGYQEEIRRILNHMLQKYSQYMKKDEAIAFVVDETGCSYDEVASLADAFFPT